MKFTFIAILFFMIAANTAAQYSDTALVTSSNKFKIKTALEIGIPSLMITYGMLSFHNQGLLHIDHSTQSGLREDNRITHHKLDNFFQFIPSVAAFSMKLSGVQSTHNLKDMVIIYGLSNLLETAIVYSTKSFVNRTRPDGSKNNSFPSGHTATAFVAAEFLHQEYKDKSIFISLGGYAVASLVGGARVTNNKHWVSDVVTGAGIGIISTKIIYWTYPYIQKTFSLKDKNRHQTFIFPSYNDGVLGLNLACRF